MKNIPILFLFVFMREGKFRVSGWLRSGLFLMVLSSLLLARCTREDTLPDSTYADPLSVALRFADDAALMQAGLERNGSFMAPFNDITASSILLISSDTVERNGINCLRQNYLWSDSLTNYRRGSINYPGSFSITRISAESSEIEFKIRFYRSDSMQVFSLQGQMFVSKSSKVFSDVSGGFILRDAQGREFEVKIDMRKQLESGGQTPTFNDDRWLVKCTGLIVSQGRSLRYATLTPLIRVSSTNCDYQAGEVGLSSDAWPAQIISYGNGNCDRFYYLSENSNQKQLILP